MRMVGLEPTRLAAQHPKCCASAISPHPQEKRRDYTLSVTSKTVKLSGVRRLIHRLSNLLIAIIALGLPLLIIFVFYLGVRQEGVFLNEGDPLRQGRIWMQHERRGPVGIGVQTSAPEVGANGQNCVRATIVFLRWSPRLELTRERGEPVC